MKKYLALLLLPAFAMPCYGRAGTNGWCQLGNRTVTTSSLISTTKVQQSFSQCLVTVFYTGGPSGTVTTAGPIVTFAGGIPFNANGGWASLAITINSVVYTISSVSSSMQLTLNSSAGTQASPVAYSLASTAPAAIYSTVGGTPLGNPFVANTDGSWRFFADDGVYDVRTNSGGMPQSFTQSAVSVLTGGVQPLLQVSCNSGPSNACFYSTQTGSGFAAQFTGPIINTGVSAIPLVTIAQLGGGASALQVTGNSVFNGNLNVSGTVTCPTCGATAGVSSFGVGARTGAVSLIAADVTAAVQDLRTTATPIFDTTFYRQAAVGSGFAWSISSSQLNVLDFRDSGSGLRASFNAQGIAGTGIFFRAPSIFANPTNAVTNAGVFTGFPAQTADIFKVCAAGGTCAVTGSPDYFTVSAAGTLTGLHMQNIGTTDNVTVNNIVINGTCTGSGCVNAGVASWGLSGTPRTGVVVFSAADITAAAQDIRTTASPTFNNLTISGTCTGCVSAGVSSWKGDPALAARTGAVVLTAGDITGVVQDLRTVAAPIFNRTFYRDTGAVSGFSWAVGSDTAGLLEFRDSGSTVRAFLNSTGAFGQGIYFSQPSILVRPTNTVTVSALIRAFGGGGQVADLLKVCTETDACITGNPADAFAVSPAGNLLGVHVQNVGTGDSPNFTRSSGTALTLSSTFTGSGASLTGQLTISDPINAVPIIRFQGPSGQASGFISSGFTYSLAVEDLNAVTMGGFKNNTGGADARDFDVLMGNINLAAGAGVYKAAGLSGVSGGTCSRFTRGICTQTP